MKLASISGVSLNVVDLDLSANFYARLGFREGKRSTASATYYVNWFWIELCLNADHDLSQALAAGSAVYIKVDSIHDSYTEILDLGLSPESEPYQAKPTIKEFRLADPDGHWLVFFEKK